MGTRADEWNARRAPRAIQASERQRLMVAVECDGCRVAPWATPDYPGAGGSPSRTICGQPHETVLACPQCETETGLTLTAFPTDHAVFGECRCGHEWRTRVKVDDHADLMAKLGLWPFSTPPRMPW